MSILNIAANSLFYKKSHQDVHPLVQVELPALVGCPLFALQQLKEGAGFYPLVSRSASANLVSWGEHEPEPVVVVPVVRRVVVTIRRPAIPGVVVPAAAASDTVRASQDRTPNLSITIRLKE